MRGRKHKARVCFNKGYTLRAEHERSLHIQAVLFIPEYPGCIGLSGEMMTHWKELLKSGECECEFIMQSPCLVTHKHTQTHFLKHCRLLFNQLFLKALVLAAEAEQDPSASALLWMRAVRAEQSTQAGSRTQSALNTRGPANTSTTYTGKNTNCT